MHKTYREAAMDNVEEAMFDSLIICSHWCDGEEYTYDLTQIVSVAKLILEQERLERDK